VGRRLGTGMKIKFAKSPSLAKLSGKTGFMKAIFSPPPILTCLEISENHVKLAQFVTQKDGRKELVYLITRKIPSAEEEVLTKVLRQMTAEFKIKGRFLSCVARNLVTVRYLKMPSVNPQEVEAMLDFQITKQMPYPKEETVYSYSILGKDATGYADILLAIVHQEVIAQHLRILKAGNLEPERVSFNALACCEWFLYGRPQISQSVLLIDIDTTYTNIGVVRGEGLFFTRAIKWGLEDFRSGNNDASILKQLLEEIRLSLSAYGKESPSTPITKAVLTGAASVLDKIKDVLEKEFGFEVEIKLPLEGIKVNKEVLEGNWFDLHGVSLNAVLGLALEQDKALKINLLPSSVKESRLKQEKQHQLLLSILLAGFIFLTGLGFITKKFHEKSRIVFYLRQSARQISTLAEALEGKKRNLDLVKEQFGQRSISLDIILELHKIVPVEINLVNFDFEDKKGVTLRGTSKAMAEVFRFVTILEKSAYFSKSQVKFVKKRGGADDLTDFEIYCPLKTEAQ
jgi:Tfp pilus assembly PilM family ATPase